MTDHPDHPVFTPATGQRLHWGELPDQVRRGLEDRLGADVVEATTQPGGFSPGVAARLKLADGRRAFVKAVSGRINPDSPGMHRRERRGSNQNSIGSWSRLGELSSALTPAPIAVEAVSELMPYVFSGWQRLAASAESRQDDLRGVDSRAQRHLAQLAALEAASPDAAAGMTLLHADMRVDNILLTPSRVGFIDWPWASHGAEWVDLLFMLPSVAMQGGPTPWEIFDVHPLGRRAPAAAVTPVVAAVAGFMIRGSRLPPPPGLPTVRAFQRDQGVPALEWLKRRTGWT